MKRKRMRLPNGFGQISEIKNKPLRKPFRAMVTVGKTESGRPICKLLKPVAYFKTYNEAYEALLRYRNDPSIFKNDFTMQEVFDEWYEEYKKGVVEHVAKRAKSLWNHLSQIHEKKIRELKALDLKIAIGEAELPSDNVLMKLKTLLNMMYDYAVMLEYVDKNYARVLKLNSPDTKAKDPHKSLTAEEMKYLWDNKDDDIVKMILVQCYMGWRPQELLDIRLSDIDMDNLTIKGGSKTEAGKDRVVPICNVIKPIVLELIDKSKTISTGDKLFYFINAYRTYYKKFKRILNNHRPHDPRKQFITMAKSVGMDEYAIKRIVGHAITDITENVYTDRDIAWLKTEINKLKPIGVGTV